MSDDSGKIIDISSFLKPNKSVAEQVSDKHDYLVSIMLDYVEKGGYDISDPELLADMEAITSMYVAALCRQMKLENEHIIVLNELRKLNKKYKA